MLTRVRYDCTFVHVYIVTCSTRDVVVYTPARFTRFAWSSPTTGGGTRREIVLDRDDVYSYTPVYVYNMYTLAAKHVVFDSRARIVI